MIGKLSGHIDGFGENFLIIDVQGVGYVVYASRRTLSHIGQNGERVSLLIDTHVREDAISLYGFMDATEQQWFRLLTSVQGVGAKVGLSILSVCTPAELPVIMAAQDKARLTQADGVGPKLAVRIVTELKDKGAALSLGSSAKISSSADSKQNSAPNDTNSKIEAVQQDAVSALVNLGYGRAEAYGAVLRAQQEAGNDNLQSLIRAALKELSA